MTITAIAPTACLALVGPLTAALGDCGYAAAERVTLTLADGALTATAVTEMTDESWTLGTWTPARLTVTALTLTAGFVTEWDEEVFTDAEDFETCAAEVVEELLLEEGIWSADLAPTDPTPGWGLPRFVLTLPTALTFERSERTAYWVLA